MLRGKIVEKGMTEKQVAKEIGMSSKTFSLKMKSGKFGLDEADKIIALLEIEKPELIFFSQTVA
jgi:transcriptional regulator with XRE-family HTH domain